MSVGFFRLFTLPPCDQKVIVHLNSHLQAKQYLKSNVSLINNQTLSLKAHKEIHKKKDPYLLLNLQRKYHIVSLSVFQNYLMVVFILFDQKEDVTLFQLCFLIISALLMDLQKEAACSTQQNKGQNCQCVSTLRRIH